MSLYLFHFVYNTLMQKANDSSPGNQLFLPVALSNMKNDQHQPYLPLHASNWGLNNINGAVDISQDLAVSWFKALFPAIMSLSQAKPGGAVTQSMIDDAKAAVTYITGQKLNVVPMPNVGPNLHVDNIEIQGLANIQVSGKEPTVSSDDQGYHAQITLNPNAYSVSAAWCQQLALAGEERGTDSNTGQAFSGLSFVLTQTLCFADRNGKIFPPPPTLGLPPSSGHLNGFDCSATGIALLYLSQAAVVADTNVGVSNAPALQIGLNTLQLLGQQSATPDYALQNLQYQRLSPIPFPSVINASTFFPGWSTFFKNLLATEDAATLLSTQVNNALMDSGNRAKVEDLLNSQLVSIFNQIFGSSQVASGGVDVGANAVDKYLFDRARGGINDVRSYIYLPTLVLGSNSPTIEPYTASNLHIDGPFSTTVLGQQVKVTDIALQNLVINGLSNLVALPGNINFGTNQQVNATLLLDTLNPGPTVTVGGHQRTVPSPPATASTAFTLNVTVGDNTPVPISGTFNITLHNNSNTLGVQTSLTASGDTPQELALNYSRIVLVAGNGDVKLAVTLPPDDAIYEQLIDPILNQSALIQSIIGAINGYIGQNLGQISQAATKFARQVLDNLGH
ncbi:hypothetical protein [Paludibacterium purpuratum]|uniref:Uncharacterized protein n=1 Tax=Paludibacterium purpuratum TaxID=1144873 RepID=A0A4R7BAI8_9NEIS|nr:hypothetical protein [Paludibacterium purpuratum]TDR81924.1 hypothetical protein DFP86_10234 [Paludibacterium purpuratum]